MSAIIKDFINLDNSHKEQMNLEIENNPKKKNYK